MPTPKLAFVYITLQGSFSVSVALGLLLDLLLPVSVNSEYKPLPAANVNGSPRNIASYKIQSQREGKGEVRDNFLIIASFTFCFRHNYSVDLCLFLWLD